MKNPKIEHLEAEQQDDYTIDFKVIEAEKQLTTIYIFKAKHYINLQSLNKFKNLQILNFMECTNLEELQQLKAYTNKIEIQLNECHNFNFQSLSTIKSLQTLRIYKCNNITFSTTTHYKYLKNLEIMLCKKANIEINFNLYPELNRLAIQGTKGDITIRHARKSRNLCIITLQFRKTPSKIEKMLNTSGPQHYQLK